MAEDYKIRSCGENNPSWKGGIDDYKGKNWNRISKNLIKEQAFCSRCQKSKDLVVHHKIPQRFWKSLDDSNCKSNLEVLCKNCHAKCLEHFWIILPKNLYNVDFHENETVIREKTKRREKPKCKICGAPVRLHKNTYCSYSCSAKAKWLFGLFGPDLIQNIKKMRKE
jgi:5-methylcytosine-specific restriction endonuclease McrA